MSNVELDAPLLRYDVNLSYTNSIVFYTFVWFEMLLSLRFWQFFYFIIVCHTILDLLISVNSTDCIDFL